MSGFRLLTATKPTPSFVVEACPQSQYQRSEARVELLAYFVAPSMIYPSIRAGATE